MAVARARREPTRPASIREPDAPRRPAAATGAGARASRPSRVLLVPTALALPDRHDPGRPRARRPTAARTWVDDGPRRPCAPDAVVVSWWSYSTPLWYAQHVEGQRPDIDDRRRPDPPRRGPGRRQRRDRRQPAHPPRLRHPRRPGARSRRSTRATTRARRSAPTRAVLTRVAGPPRGGG